MIFQVDLMELHLNNCQFYIRLGAYTTRKDYCIASGPMWK